MVQTNNMFTEIIIKKHHEENFYIFKHTIFQVVHHEIDNKGLEEVTT